MLLKEFIFTFEGNANTLNVCSGLVPQIFKGIN